MKGFSFYERHHKTREGRNFYPWTKKRIRTSRVLKSYKTHGICTKDRLLRPTLQSYIPKLRVQTMSSHTIGRRPVIGRLGVTGVRILSLLLMETNRRRSGRYDCILLYTYSKIVDVFRHIWIVCVLKNNLWDL